MYVEGYSVVGGWGGGGDSHSEKREVVSALVLFRLHKCIDIQGAMEQILSASIVAVFYHYSVNWLLRFMVYIISLGKLVKQRNLVSSSVILPFDIIFF